MRSVSLLLFIVVFSYTVYICFFRPFVLSTMTMYAYAMHFRFEAVEYISDLDVNQMLMLNLQQAKKSAQTHTFDNKMNCHLFQSVITKY